VTAVAPATNALTGTITFKDGAVMLVDSNAAAYPSRFYRAYSP
jgi:hypothetical protein